MWCSIYHLHFVDGAEKSRSSTKPQKTFRDLPQADREILTMATTPQSLRQAL